MFGNDTTDPTASYYDFLSGNDNAFDPAPASASPSGGSGGSSWFGNALSSLTALAGAAAPIIGAIKTPAPAQTGVVPPFKTTSGGINPLYLLLAAGGLVLLLVVMVLKRK
jgi:hypothetical protein